MLSYQRTVQKRRKSFRDRKAILENKILNKVIIIVIITDDHHSYSTEVCNAPALLIFDDTRLLTLFDVKK